MNNIEAPSKLQVLIGSPNPLARLCGNMLFSLHQLHLSKIKEIPVHQHEDLTAAMHSILSDEDVTGENEKFEGHEFVVECMRRALRKMKEAAISASLHQPIHDIDLLIEGKQNERSIKSVERFIHYCTESIKHQRSFCKRITRMEHVGHHYA